MFFSKKREISNHKTNIVKVAALLIHAAKIDQQYSNEEEIIIKKTLLGLGVNEAELEDIISKAKKYEEDTNQILEFTKEIKNLEETNKIKIIQSLWRIIYSNNDADIYETNLMRRLAGLLYIDNKTMGDIKEQIKKENS